MTDHDNNGWPFADRPGVPLNPERDGYHWLAATDGDQLTGHMAVMFWFAGTGFYAIEAVPVTQRSIVSGWRYLGPCLTPAEVAAERAAAAAEVEARVAEARKAALREAAKMARYWPQGITSRGQEELSDAIRALPLPGDTP